MRAPDEKPNIIWNLAVAIASRAEGRPYGGLDPRGAVGRGARMLCPWLVFLGCVWLFVLPDVRVRTSLRRLTAQLAQLRATCEATRSHLAELEEEEGRSRVEEACLQNDKRDVVLLSSAQKSFSSALLENATETGRGVAFQAPASRAQTRGRACMRARSRHKRPPSVPNWPVPDLYCACARAEESPRITARGAAKSIGRTAQESPTTHHGSSSSSSSSESVELRRPTPRLNLNAWTRG